MPLMVGVHVVFFTLTICTLLRVMGFTWQVAGEQPNVGTVIRLRAITRACSAENENTKLCVSVEAAVGTVKFNPCCATLVW